MFDVTKNETTRKNEQARPTKKNRKQIKRVF